MNAFNECQKISIHPSHTVIEDNIRQKQSGADLSTRPKPQEANTCQSKRLTKLCSTLVQHYLTLNLMQWENPRCIYEIFINATGKSVGLVAGLHLIPPLLYLSYPFPPCLLIIIIDINDSGSGGSDMLILTPLLYVIYLLVIL